MSQVIEDIDKIMEEMEAATPKFSDNSKTFEEFSERLPDDVDAKPAGQSWNFFSSILAPKPKKPGMVHGSRPTEQQYYDFSHPNIGHAVIFNQVRIKGESERAGSEKDARDLYEVLVDIGFNVRIYTDCTVKQISEELINLSQKDHSDNDCLLITIMTHGKKDGKIYASDSEFVVNDLWKNFTGDNCETLIGKPKLFFIQACRGTSTDPGIVMQPKRAGRMMTQMDAVDAKISREEYFVLPTLADILVMYSTAEGFYSFRNPKDGSWFIQALCEELRKNSSEELMRILTGVNRRVAYAKQSYHHDYELDALKQMPIIQSMLTKDFYFLKRHQKDAITLPAETIEMNIAYENVRANGSD